MVDGELIGVGEMKYYPSCKIHFTKVNDNNECSKCEKSLTENDVLEDCRVEMYLEDKNSNKNDEVNVIEILAFRKTLDPQYTGNIQKTVDDLMNKTMKIQYNIDDAKRNIAVTVEVNE